MKLSFKKGFSFGLTSGIITTLGLIVGLSEGIHLKSAVIGAILVIAIADSLSDAFGMHISEEAENQHSHEEVWQSTFSTLLAKFVFALTFIVPVLFFNLTTAVFISIGWGLSVISLVSYYLARQEQKPVSKVIGEHVSITILVIVLTYFVGYFISALFG
jgi:VIT1/CCC1 family predicted Fe2+/Mn2+ transporter